MPKTYILDTSVLAHDPNCLKSFKSSLIVIPVNVLNELDKLKTQPSEAGKNCRLAIRMLDTLSNKGAIHKGIKIENKSTVKIDTTSEDESFGNSDYTDNLILACAKRYSKSAKNQPVSLVSRDINLRIRARAAGLLAEDYEKNSKKDTGELFKGYREIVSSELGSLLQERGTLDCDIYDEVKDMYPNEGVSFTGEDGKGLALGRRVGNKIQLLKGQEPWGIRSRSKEQAFAIDLLMDPKIPLVTIAGASGGGKTLLCMSSVLEQVIEQKKYQKSLIYRPIQVVGNEIGLLPGTAFEKIYPYYMPIIDSLEYLLSGNSSKKGDKWKTMLDMWMEKEVITFEPMAYIRGRSIANSIMVIDEAQNLPRDLAKTILSRANHGTKIIITGDIDQIDAARLDHDNNMLSLIVDKFKTSPLAGSVVFNKSERSPLAAEAIKIL